VPEGCSSIGGTALPAERYDQVALTSGGVVVSICAADFGPVVDTLSEASIVWRMDFPLREPPLSGSLHVEIDGSTIPETDFVLEGSLLSFPEPPPPESQIDVRYLVRMDSR
jgi:hypothetical protein